MFINITILSKNYQFLKLFLKFCFKNKSKFDKIFFKCLQNKNKKVKIVLLKSPHVNKKAQQHFELNIFLKKFKIFSFQLLKFLILLKKFKTFLFLDIKIQIKFLLNKNMFLVKKRKFFKN